MATRSAKTTKGVCHGRPGLMSYAGLRPRPGSMAEWDPGSGGVASLNHRLPSGIPPGCAPGCGRAQAGAASDTRRGHAGRTWMRVSAGGWMPEASERGAGG